MKPSLKSESYQSDKPDGWRDVQWRHFAALLNLGIPAKALTDKDSANGFRFRVIEKRGREYALFKFDNCWPIG